jgi:hypothetical protein
VEARIVAKFVHRISFRLCFGFNCLNRFFNTLSLELVLIQIISVCLSLSLSLSVCLSVSPRVFCRGRNQRNFRNLLEMALTAAAAGAD